MIVHLIRHGEKLKGDFYDPRLRRQDNPLSEKGQLQARLLSEYLPNKIDTILVSNLQRTRQTISPYAAQREYAVIEDERINEIDMGVLSRLPETEVRTKYPRFWTEYQEKVTDYRYPEGENGEDVSSRIRSLMKEQYASDKELIIVGHDGWIRVFICILLGLEYQHRFKFRIANCGISTVQINSQNLDGSIIRINDCSFLKENISYDR